MTNPAKGYAEWVVRYFYDAGGRDWSLSALDRALIDRWSAQGVPREVVARGIDRRAERGRYTAAPGTPALKTLRSCEDAVEDEWMAYRARMAGARLDGEPARDEGWVEAMLAQAEASRPELAPRLNALAHRWLKDSASQADDFFPLLLGLALPFAERLQLLREARQRANETPAMSAASAKASRRFFRCSSMRRALGLETVGGE